MCCEAAARRDSLVSRGLQSLGSIGVAVVPYENTVVVLPSVVLEPAKLTPPPPCVSPGRISIQDDA